MALTIIVPAYDEARCIAATLENVRRVAGDAEVLVVDGGSRDDTVAIAERCGVRVIRSKKGRAAQMNAGAAAAAGDVLLFLHADTRLPDDARARIDAAMGDTGQVADGSSGSSRPPATRHLPPPAAGGCFQLSFDAPIPLLRFYGFMTRFPFRLFHFGDAGFFVRADVFRRMGGFREMPLMEDLEFWLRLRKEGRTVILDRAVVTSARRFLQRGVIHQQLLNIAFVGMYIAGVKPETLARWYPPIREYRLPFRRATLGDQFVDALRTLWHWPASNLHNLHGTYSVLRFMFDRRLHAGVLPPDHPWVTGLAPDDGKPIWPRNLVFASPRTRNFDEKPEETDEAIVARVGRFMSGLVDRSAQTPEIPRGNRRRMPHAVNLLHGAVHYNGGFLVFDDALDAMYHLSDPAFAREIRRFARTEQRELTVVLRERRVIPEEYAYLVAFVRSKLPWYANGNGPTGRRVLWGTPSPYPAINPIASRWIRDVDALADGEAPVRPPIDRSKWFRGEYRGHQPEFPFLVRFHAWVMGLIVAARGFQGGMLFTPRKWIEPEKLEKYREGWRPSYRVPHPFRRVPRT